MTGQDRTGHVQTKILFIGTLLWAYDLIYIMYLNVLHPKKLTLQKIAFQKWEGKMSG